MPKISPAITLKSEREIESQKEVVPASWIKALNVCRGEGNNMLWPTKRWSNPQITSQKKITAICRKGALITHPPFVYLL
jgi:hypothetical protein